MVRISTCGIWLRATLAGTNIYVHHPAYPGGPYAYLPLFLYVELPFQWFAQTTHVPFVILGKFPIVAGDVATAVLLARLLRRRGAGERCAVLGAALFLFNPLVLYDGAFYGRFDTFAMALLMAALVNTAVRPRRAAVVYGLAVAAKTFPIFGLLGFVRSIPNGRITGMAMFVATLAVVTAPFLATWRAVLRDAIAYDAAKNAQGLSWQTIITPVVSSPVAKAIDVGCLVLFAAGLIALLAIPDLTTYVLATLTLFVLCSKVVLEQYLVWIIPLAIVVALSQPPLRSATAALAILSTLVGMLANADFHPWGPAPTALVAALAATCAAVLTALVRHGIGSRTRLANRLTPRSSLVAASNGSAPTSRERE
jgi:hypothetical protein